MKTHKHIIRSVSSLIPYARNARTHSDAQVAQLAASIREFGFTSPVVIDEDGGILAGHGRVMALRKLGVEEVPCIEAAGLTQAQRRAYVLADNKLALNAGWDEDLLRVELEELTGLGFDLDLTGFDEAEVDALLLGEPEEEQSKGLSDAYTKKITPPVYEPHGPCPPVSDLYDRAKTEQLIEAIDKATLPDDVRGFLLAAAHRHTVFNFRNIAEFYAHAGPDVQRLFEASALVVIDWDDAIANGFVKMTKALMEIADDEAGA
jgi:hypothetical protein